MFCVFFRQGALVHTPHAVPHDSQEVVPLSHLLESLPEFSNQSAVILDRRATADMTQSSVSINRKLTF